VPKPREGETSPTDVLEISQRQTKLLPFTLQITWTCHVAEV